MPLTALLLLLATLLPLASFVLLLFVGKRMGNPLAGYVGTAAIAGSFVCTLIAMMLWMTPSTYTDPNLHAPLEIGMLHNPINLPIPWIPIGTAANSYGVAPGQVGAQDHPGFLDLGIYVDSLTVAMFAMITLVSTLIHIFSIGYMAEDKAFPRFFTYLSLFCFSMLGLVLGGTILQLFIFWELVGLCSYLLIGFWYEKRSASNAAIKAFVTNRVGDCGFLIGFGILVCHLGNATLPHMWTALCEAGSGHGLILAGGISMSPTLLTIMGIGLFCGAIGKSAQFPLHVWLPDAMEGPTPVSALIHAATMVAAGVYLVARIFPILTPDAKLFVAIIGCTTLTMAALIALAQSDIKKVLAFSTLSQLGYMIMAMGVGSWVGGMFHLITHAFFKALLFLGSGSVIAAMHHEQEMPQYGGLMRKIPLTAIAFGIAVLAISGTPGFSGFYSKDMIVRHAAAFASYAVATGHSPWYWAFFVLPTVIAYVTAFYMMRCWMLTFWGKPRNQHLYDHAHETALLWGPLAVLAVLSIISGYYTAPSAVSRSDFGIGAEALINSSIAESESYCKHLAPGADTTVFAKASPVEVSEGTSLWDKAAARGEELTAPLKSWLFWGFLVGIAGGFLMYYNGYAVAQRLYAFKPFRWIHTWLYHRMYFDELYALLVVGVLMAVAWICGMIDRFIVDGLVNLSATVVRWLSDLAGRCDQYVVDGAVNGAADLAQDFGALVRSPQTGRVRMYVMVLMVAVALGLAVTVVFVLS